MKVAKIVIMAMVVALASTGLAMAAGTVQMNQVANISVDVQNNGDRDVYAAVKMQAYDNVGNNVGNVCQVVRLANDRVTTVSYNWRAPGYATGLYWSPKVEVGGDCVNQDSGVTDYHDGDSDSDDHWDSDSDSDDHWH